MRELVVVDANIAVKLVLQEPDSDIAIALIKNWSKNTVTMIAPYLLTYEVTNILYQSVCKGKMTVPQAKKALLQVLSLGIELEFLKDTALSTRAIELSHKYNLSATYDPHYLALAERETCDFWTADAKLWNALKEKLSWVHLLEEYHPGNSHKEQS